MSICHLVSAPRWRRCSLKRRDDAKMLTRDDAIRRCFSKYSKTLRIQKHFFLKKQVVIGTFKCCKRHSRLQLANAARITRNCLSMQLSGSLHYVNKHIYTWQWRDVITGKKTDIFEQRTRINKTRFALIPNHDIQWFIGLHLTNDFFFNFNSQSWFWDSDASTV